MVKGELKTLRITLEATEAAVLGYVYLQDIQPGQVDHTAEVIPSVMADYDAGGRLLGIELLDAGNADAAFMSNVAKRLGRPELAGIDLAAMCRTTA
jgi:uncharacterized protein YuzE